MYELLIDSLNKNKSDIAICNLFYETQDMRYINEFNHEDFVFDREKYPEYSYFIKSISGYACNRLYSKHLIYCKKGYHIQFDANIVIAEDDLFNYEIFNQNKKIKYSYINNKLYHYVLNTNSATNQMINMKKLTYFNSKEKEIRILQTNNLNNDFLKADYIINQVRTKIIMKKLKIKSELKFEYITKKANEYKKEINYKDLNLKLKLKLIVATKLPLLYRLKLKNKFN